MLNQHKAELTTLKSPEALETPSTSLFLEADVINELLLYTVHPETDVYGLHDYFPQTKKLNLSSIVSEGYPNFVVTVFLGGRSLPKSKNLNRNCLHGSFRKLLSIVVCREATYMYMHLISQRDTPVTKLI